MGAGTSWPAAWAAMARDHGRTASPNAGWTMAAMAGALGVTLQKPAAYRLGHGPLPAAADVERGVAVARRAALLALLGMMTLRVVLEKVHHPAMLATLSSW